MTEKQPHGNGQPVDAVTQRVREAFNDWKKNKPEWSIDQAEEARRLAILDQDPEYQSLRSQVGPFTVAQETVNYEKSSARILAIMMQVPEPHQ